MSAPINGHTVTDAPSRTRAATAASAAARRRAKSEKLIAELVARLPELDRPLLAALAVCVVDEIERRAQNT